MYIETANRKTLVNRCFRRIGGGSPQIFGLVSRAVSGALGRISSAAWPAAAVFFASLCVLASCSADEGDAPASPQSDYSLLLPHRDWEVTTAAQRVTPTVAVDVRETETHCRFTGDSVRFSLVGLSVHFDADGTVTQSVDTVPYAAYPYTLHADRIQIDTQLFTITPTPDSTLVLENDGWRLVLREDLNNKETTN